MAATGLDLGRTSRAVGIGGGRASYGTTSLEVTRLVGLSLALLIVGNLGRVPILDAGQRNAPLLLNDLLVIGVVASAAFTAIRSRRLHLDGPAALAIAFAAIGGLSALLAVPRFSLTGPQFLISIAYLLRWLLYFGVYLAVVNFVRRREVEGLWRVAERAILVFAGFGIFQSMFLPGFAQIVQPEGEWDAQGHRLVSSFLDPNFAGGLIMIGLLVTFGRIACGVPTHFGKPMVLATALLLTLSRSSVFAAVVGVLVLLAARGLSRRLVRVGTLLLALLIPFSPLLFVFAQQFNRFSVTGSAAERFLAWVQALEVLSDSPVLGIGFNTYGFVQEFYNHSDAMGFHYFSLDGGLLFIAVMTGGVGVTIYSAMLLVIARRCRRIIRSPSHSAEERGLALGVLAVTVAIVVHSVFVNSLLFTLLMHPLWVLWAMTHVIEREERPDGEQAYLKAEPVVPVLALARA